MRRALDLAWTHRRVAVLTFELFWILVALLEVAARDDGPGIVPFVYVNF